MFFFEESKVEYKYKVIEEWLKAIEGNKVYGLDLANMCLVPDVIIPPKFKAPEFDKYKGVTCAKTHMKTYIRKMAARTKDDKLLTYWRHGIIS